MISNKRITNASWLRVETKYACYALAFENGRIIGGAPYGMKVIGHLRDIKAVQERLTNMGAKCVILSV